MDFANIDDLWNLHDSHTVQQAAALIAGFDPCTVRWNSLGDLWFENEHGLTENEGVNRVTSSFSALVNAINGMTLTATIRQDANSGAWNEHLQSVESTREIRSGHVIFKESPNWSLTTVTRTDLVKWLHSRGKKKGFFFPDGSLDTPGYFDPGHPRYAPKLAAAVHVWQAMEDENLRKTGKPITDMTAWLESRYKEFGLVHKQAGKNKDGQATHKIGDWNGGAITQVCQVANWSDGGAPTTPGG